jgi:hypothetical protein
MLSPLYFSNVFVSVFCGSRARSRQITWRNSSLTIDGLIMAGMSVCYYNPSWYQRYRMRTDMMYMSTKAYGKLYTNTNTYRLHTNGELIRKPTERMKLQLLSCMFQVTHNIGCGLLTYVIDASEITSRIFTQSMCTVGFGMLSRKLLNLAGGRCDGWARL